MAIYNINGTAVADAYDINGESLSVAYDINGDIVTGDIPPYIYGTAYPLSTMQYTADDNTAESSALHTRNGSATIKFAPTTKGDVNTSDSDKQWVTFTCNINTNGQNAGLWIYIAPDSCRVYGGKTSLNDGLGLLKIKLNNSTSYTWETVKAGMEYYVLRNPPSTITSISVSAINSTYATSLTSCMYLDSLEVGFSPKKAHIIFSLDCVPSNFMSVGYPLFEEYGLKCTLQYPISSSDSTPGADSDYLNVQLHEQLVSEGYDYCTYSGWQSYENGGSAPFYDDTSKQALFEAHAERMWKVNNDSGIYAPSGVNGTGFLWGYVYNDACRDYNFLLIRRGEIHPNDNNALMAYYDDSVRTMMPYFLQNVWTASATNVTRLKARIDRAIDTKQALLVGFHEVKDSSYTPGSNDIYIGEDAVEEILSYVKTKVDSDDIICCTIADYVKEMSPTTYATWYAQRNPQI